MAWDVQRHLENAGQSDADGDGHGVERHHGQRRPESAGDLERADEPIGAVKRTLTVPININALNDPVDGTSGLNAADIVIAFLRTPSA